MGASPTLIALGVAFISLLPFSLPSLKAALSSTRSKVDLSNPVVRGETLYVVASNVGKEPGVIKQGHLDSRFLTETVDLEMVDPAGALVAPGAKQVGLKVRFRLNPVDARTKALEVVGAPRENLDKAAGNVAIFSLQSDGRSTETTFPLSHAELFTLLDAHASRCDGVSKPSFENGCEGLIDIQAESDRAHERIQGKLDRASKR